MLYILSNCSLTSGWRQQTQMPLAKQLGFLTLAYRARASLYWTKAAPCRFKHPHCEQVQPELTTCDPRWMMIWTMSNQGWSFSVPPLPFVPQALKLEKFFLLKICRSKHHLQLTMYRRVPDSCINTKPGKWSCEKLFLPFLQQRASKRGNLSNNI